MLFGEIGAEWSGDYRGPYQFSLSILDLVVSVQVRVPEAGNITQQDTMPINLDLTEGILKELVELIVPPQTQPRRSRLLEMFCCLVERIFVFLGTYPIRPSGWTKGEALLCLVLLPAIKTD